MAIFYINGVSRALRSVQRVDLNYNIAAAVRAGDSQRRRKVTDSGFAGVSLVGPPSRVGVAPAGWPWRPLPTHPVV